MMLVRYSNRLIFGPEAGLLGFDHLLARAARHGLGEVNRRQDQRGHHCGYRDDVAGGQRDVLVSVADGSLLTAHYDGEGRFGRDSRGRVTHFVYYEFGRRLGIARKTTSAS